MTEQIAWEIDSTNSELGGKIRAFLREIVDPELGMNIIELGLIREVVCNQDNIHITMILTTPFCPYGPSMLRDTRLKAQSISEVPVVIELSLEPWSPELMEEGAGGDWGMF